MLDGCRIISLEAQSSALQLSVMINALETFLTSNRWRKTVKIFIFVPSMSVNNEVFFEVDFRPSEEKQKNKGTQDSNLCAFKPYQVPFDPYKMKIAVIIF